MPKPWLRHARYFISNSKDQCIKLWDTRKSLRSERETAMLPREGIPQFNWDYRWMAYPGNGLDGQALASVLVRHPFLNTCGLLACVVVSFFFGWARLAGWAGWIHHLCIGFPCVHLSHWVRNMSMRDSTGPGASSHGVVTPPGDLALLPLG
eukprot:1155681-Pelagomonas_calceolata.AAC.10